MQITGKADKDAVVVRGSSCFMALTVLADFDATQVNSAQTMDVEISAEVSHSAPKNEYSDVANVHRSGGSGLGLNLGYTINLNLPATSDPAVFNAIFKSLKEHLLRDEDV